MRRSAINGMKGSSLALIEADEIARTNRPALKWAGGKRWLVPYLRPIWAEHSHRRLVEPMCGGIAVALGLMPKRALLNDINPHVINFYRWLKKGLKVSLPMRNDEKLYYKNRDRFNWLIHQDGEESKEAAELFYYLNKTGYNGLCRFNGGGGYNVPFGKYKQINYTVDFSIYKKIFANWEFTMGDFEAIRLQKDDFVYVDPPYDVEFTKYSKEDFRWKDQVRLAEWLVRQDVVAVLSNQATDRIIKLYKNLGFRLDFANAPRLISCNGDRSPAKEVIATREI